MNNFKFRKGDVVTISLDVLSRCTGMDPLPADSYGPLTGVINSICGCADGQEFYSVKVNVPNRNIIYDIPGNALVLVGPDVPKPIKMERISTENLCIKEGYKVLPHDKETPMDELMTILGLYKTEDCCFAHIDCCPRFMSGAMLCIDGKFYTNINNLYCLNNKKWTFGLQLFRKGQKLAAVSSVTGLDRGSIVTCSGYSKRDGKPVLIVEEDDGYSTNTLSYACENQSCFIPLPVSKLKGEIGDKIGVVPFEGLDPSNHIEELSIENFEWDFDANEVKYSVVGEAGVTKTISKSSCGGCIMPMEEIYCLLNELRKEPIQIGQQVVINDSESKNFGLVVTVKNLMKDDDAAIVSELDDKNNWFPRDLLCPIKNNAPMFHIGQKVSLLLPKRYSVSNPNGLTVVGIWDPLGNGVYDISVVDVSGRYFRFSEFELLPDKSGA